MRKGLLCVIASLMALIANPANASEMQQSNTVKSSELITDFAIIKDASDAQVAGVFTLYKAGVGDRGPTMLTISPDEKISLSLGDTTYACKPSEPCRIPYQADGVYRVEFQRFNGEVFKAEVSIPNETRILTPQDNAIIGGKTAIDFSWVVSRDFGPRGITLSVFLDEQITTCSTTGFLDWATEGTAKAPAEYVSTCQLPLRARFGVFYLNLTPVKGVAGGTLKGYSTARINFTYMDTGIQFKKADKPMSRAEILDFLGSAPAARAATQIRVR